MANAFQNFVSSLTKKPPAGTSLSSLNTGYSPLASTTPTTQSSSNMSIAPKQSQPLTNNFFPANQGATGVTSTNLTTPTTARNGYVSGLAGNGTTTTPPAYNNVTGLLTPYGQSQGLPQVNGNTTGRNSGTGAPTGTPTPTGDTTGTADTTGDPKDAYLNYLQTLFDPAKATSLETQREGFDKRSSDELLSARAQDESLRRNDTRQLSFGQSYDLNENERQSNKSLADIAIARAPIDAQYNTILGAGQSLYDAQQSATQNLPAAAQEYEYAKKNGYTGSFTDYQNEDANRKATGSGGNDPAVADAYVQGINNGSITSIASVPAEYRNAVATAMAKSGVTTPLADSRLALASTRIAANYLQLPQYTLTANGLPYLQRIDAAMKTPGSVSDQDLLDSLTKLNTAGNAISDAQVRLITDGRSLSDEASVLKNKLSTGGVLSTTQRKQIQDIAQAIFKNYQVGYQPVYDQVAKQLTQAGIPKQFWTIPDLNNLSSGLGGLNLGGGSGEGSTSSGGTGSGGIYDF